MNVPRDPSRRRRRRSSREKVAIARPILEVDIDDRDEERLRAAAQQPPVDESRRARRFSPCRRTSAAAGGRAGAGRVRSGCGRCLRGASPTPRRRTAPGAAAYLGCGFGRDARRDGWRRGLACGTSRTRTGASVRKYGSSPMRGNSVSAEHLHRRHALEPRQIQLDRLHGARQVGDAQHDLVLVAPHVGEHLPVLCAAGTRSCRGRTPWTACAARSSASSS